MPAKPIMIEPQMPHSALPDADWADCYELQVPASDVTAMTAARAMLGHFPFWVRSLLRLRNALTAVFGLRSTEYPVADAAEMIGFFPVVSKSDNQVVLGFDDKHLDFRVVVDTRDGEASRLVAVTTLVKRKILLGKIYIFVITPFHRLIVATMLTNFGRRVSSSPSR
ncbi:MAG: DUF2867 domain-containing protein [Rhizobium sp.]